jgi:sec-independent protein translocase protein TatA
MALAVIPGLGSVGPMELLILLTIILLLFGAKRIPELAKGLGTGIREFRKGTSGQEEKDELNEKEKEGALAGGAGDAKDSARMHEETAHEEHASKHAEERDDERVDQGAKRAEQNL